MCRQRTTTYDEDDHSDGEKITKKVSHLRKPRTSTKLLTMNHTTQTVNRRKTRLRPTHKTPNEQESNQDADSNTSFDRAPPDDLEHELEVRADNMALATREADDLLATDGITPWILRHSRMYWKQARAIPKHQDGRWTKVISKWSPAISAKQKGYRKQGRPAKRWEDDITLHLLPTKIHTDKKRSHERHDLAHRGTGRLEMGLHGKRLCEQQTQTTNKTDNQTNSSRINNTRG